MTHERNVKFVDLGRQYRRIQPEIDRAISRVLDRTDFILGDDVHFFEEEFAAYCEAKYAVGLDSGTSALELGLRALGIGPGDEVLVPTNSFIASASAVSFTGAKPVLVDANPFTYTIDVQELTKHITPRTRAIMPVHLYGQPAEMGTIMQVAEQHNLFVIEDACQAHGARYKGRRVGSFGQVAAFSFYPAKNLGGCGDGGALVTNDQGIAEAVRVMRNCGQRDKYNHVVLGGTRRLDTIQAAVLRVKLHYLEEWNGRRRELAGMYDRALQGSGMFTPLAMPSGEHVYHIYAVQASRRDQLGNFLKSEGVGVGIHYPTPIHLQPAYASLGYRPGDLRSAERCAPRLLSLPMFPEMEEDEVEFVANCIWSFTGKRRDAMGQPPIREAAI